MYENPDIEKAKELLCKALSSNDEKDAWEFADFCKDNVFDLSDRC